LKLGTLIAKSALIGLLIAGAILVFTYWENGHRQYISSTLDGLIQVIVLLLCPPIIGAMAADNAHGFFLVLVAVEIVVLNATWYAVLGGLLFWFQHRTSV
jgi:hypothetical protein